MLLYVKRENISILSQVGYFLIYSVDMWIQTLDLGTQTEGKWVLPKIFYRRHEITNNVAFRQV